MRFVNTIFAALAQSIGSRARIEENDALLFLPAQASLVYQPPEPIQLFGGTGLTPKSTCFAFGTLPLNVDVDASIMTFTEGLWHLYLSLSFLDNAAGVSDSSAYGAYNLVINQASPPVTQSTPLLQIRSVTLQKRLEFPLTVVKNRPVDLRIEIQNGAATSLRLIEYSVQAVRLL